MEFIFGLIFGVLVGSLFTVVMMCCLASASEEDKRMGCDDEKNS